MDAAGYVTRVPCPQDRRVTFARVSDVGRAKLDEAVLHQQTNVRLLFRDFSEAELAMLDTFLDRLRGSDRSPCSTKDHHDSRRRTSSRSGR